MSWQPGDRVSLLLPRKGTRGLVRVKGTVREVDPPDMPISGVRVDLDETINGVRDCFAAHAELEKEDG